MDYLISPFGFPPVAFGLNKEIDDQISSTNNQSAYEEAFSLLSKICEENLWYFSFTDSSKILQNRSFSNPRFFFISGYQIRGLAELHLALKIHLDTSLKLEDSRIGYSNVYFFDVLNRIQRAEENIVVSHEKKPIFLATWKKVELNADLIRNADDKEYIHASYPLHYVCLKKSPGLKTTNYEDFICLFKELGIIDPKHKKFVLSYFENYIFELNNNFYISYSDKLLINSKILVLHILGRFLHIEAQIVSEYLEQKKYIWYRNTNNQNTFFSVVLNGIFGLIDDLIVKREIAAAKQINSDVLSEYSQFKELYNNYNFDNCEYSEYVDHINQVNYYSDFEDGGHDFHDKECSRDYIHAVQLDSYEDAKTINFSSSELPIPDLFTTPQDIEENYNNPLALKLNSNSDLFSGIDFSNSIEFNQKDESEKKTTNMEPEPCLEKQVINNLLTQSYSPEINLNIKAAQESVAVLLKTKASKTKKQFDDSLDFSSTEKFITIDTSVDHNDIVKKVTESKKLLTVEEKKQAVLAMQDAKIKHPFIPRLNDTGAWTILTKKWLHLLSYVETNEVVNTALTNRSTYFDLMCLKNNVLKSWNELESGYLQHEYLKSISFEVFNTIYETWEYRHYINDMASTLINNGVSISRDKYAINLTSRESIEWNKLTEEQLKNNIFIESYRYKYDIILPEMRDDKISELKTAFSQLYDNVESNYNKIFKTYPGASHIFRLSAILIDLLLLNIQAKSEYKMEIRDDIFLVLANFKADFYDARKLDDLTEDRFYVQSILSDIEPFVRRRVSPEEIFKF